MSQYNIKISDASARVHNPIRYVSDNTKPSQSSKTQIKLSIGDPTLDGNLLPSVEMITAVQEAAASHKHDGYIATNGSAEAREHVAEYWRSRFVSSGSESCKQEVKAENVFLTSGGTHAIGVALSAVCNPGDNILVPAPGFPTYETVAKILQVEIRHYKLDPHKGWEANPAELEALKDERTKVIVMTNPSNPCGSNYSRQHVTEMVELAERLCLPLFSDEIYAGLVFQNDSNPQKEFVSVADIESKAVRVVLGGTAKLFTVPGWRVAWLILIDPLNVAAGYHAGMAAQCVIVLGPSSLSQASLSALLTTPQSHVEKIRDTVAAGSFLFYEELNAKARRTSDGAPLLKAYLPQGAMYVMVEVVVENFDANSPIKDDMSFYAALNEEENVLVIPGKVFNIPNFFRVVTTRESSILKDAVDRMVEVCHRHEAK